MKNRELIEEIANEVGGSIREDYSGRGMYGAQCLAVVCDDPDACLEVAGSKGIRGGVVDSMGLSYIVYWPRLKE